LAQSTSIVDFNVKLLATIDDTMSALLGASALNTLHEHLTKEYNLAPDKLPHRIDTFVEVLDSVFGVAGSKTIGMAIASNFYSEIGLRFVASENFRLQDYLEHAKKTFAIHD